MTQTTLQSPLPSRLRMTYDEFLKMDFSEQRAEWVIGAVSFRGTVSKLHARPVRFLMMLIQCWAESQGSGEVCFEPFNMKTGPDLPGRNPDVLYVSPDHADRIQANYLLGPADLVVEVRR